MNYETLVERALEEIPEFNSFYYSELENNNLFEDSGVHVVFSYVFVPLFTRAIKSNNQELVKRLSEFLEKMEESDDVLVQEVSAFTVIEELADEFSSAELDEHLLPNSLKSSREIRQYIIN